MFRFTIRELLILTFCTGLGIGWWLDHWAGVEAAQDARMLAHFSANGPQCGNEIGYMIQLERKYGAERLDMDGRIDLTAGHLDQNHN